MSGYLHTGLQVKLLEKYLYINCYCNTIQTRRIWDHPKYPLREEWIRENVVHSHKSIILAAKRNGVMSFVGN